MLRVEGIAHTNAYTRLPGRPGKDGGADRVGSIFLELYDRPDRRLDSESVLESVRELTKDMVGIQVELQPMDMGPPVEKAYKSSCPLTIATSLTFGYQNHRLHAYPSLGCSRHR